MPKVSVIIPTYNRKKYIGACLDSVLAQTFTNFEIIVIDDGSTDSTQEILQEYVARDARIIVIRQENSGKPSIARNKGIQYSTGEYIAFIDSDDLYEPTKLEFECTLLDKYADVNVVFSDMYLIEESGIKYNGTFFSKIGFNVSGNNHAKFVGDNCYVYFYSFFANRFIPIPTQTVMVRRSRLLIETEWFSESMVICEDLDLWLRLVVNTEILCIDKPLACYRRHGANITNDLELHVLGDIAVLVRYCERMLDVFTDEEKRVVRQRIAIELFDLAYYYKQNKRYREANANYLESLKWQFSTKTVLAAIKAFCLHLFG